MPTHCRHTRTRPTVRCLGNVPRPTSEQPSSEPPDDDPPPDEPSELDPELDEPSDASDLDYEDLPCTDDGDDSRWEAFIPDDDERDPEPGPGDFWMDSMRDSSVASQARELLSLDD